jgi:hypothetical protein
LTACTNDNNNTGETLNGSNISTIDRVNRTHWRRVFSGGCRRQLKEQNGHRRESLICSRRRQLGSVAADERAHANTADRSQYKMPRPTRGSTMRATATMAIMQAVNHARGIFIHTLLRCLRTKAATASKAPPPRRGRPRVVESVDNTDLYNKTSS